MLVFVLKSAAFVSDQSHQANSFHTLRSHNFKDVKTQTGAHTDACTSAGQTHKMLAF